MAKPANEMKNDILFKYTLIGNVEAGKSNLLLRFAEEQFLPRYIATIGVDFKSISREIENKKIKLLVWDTSGDERFQAITSGYYCDARVILTVVGFQKGEAAQAFITRAISEFNKWSAEILRYAYSKVPVFLAINKADLINQADRDLIENELLKYAKHNNVYQKILFTSAKTGEGIEELFADASRVALKQVQSSGNVSQATVAKDKSLNSDNFFKKNKYRLLALLLLLGITATVVLSVIFPPLGLATWLPTMAGAVGLGGASTALLAIIAGFATLAIGAMVYGLLCFAIGSEKAWSIAKAKGTGEQLLPENTSVSTGPTVHQATEVVGPPAAYQQLLTPFAPPVTGAANEQFPTKGQVPGLTNGSK